jgi:ferrous iron transport protein A
MNLYKNLLEMKQGEEGVVADIRGGIGLYRRLDAMGVTKGSKLCKISDSFLRGPVTVQVGRARLALGFGMSRRVILEVIDKASI